MLNRFALAASCIAALFLVAFASSNTKEHHRTTDKNPGIQRVIRLHKGDRELTIKQKNIETEKRPLSAPDATANACDSVWRDMDERCYG